MDQLIGYIERITFQNPETGYTIAQLKEAKKEELTCIVGTMPSLRPGETVRCEGEWKRHLIHGMQFEVKACHTEAPASVLGIKKYLGSGLIKGIGPKYASLIVDTFQEQTLIVIDQTPDLLLTIPGLGKKRLEKIIHCWQEQKSIREVMIFLQSYEVSPAFAQKIFKTYGQKSVHILKTNPYSLAKDIFGIGFKTADQIAQKLGMAPDSKERIDVGIVFFLNELSKEGHTCYPYDLFLDLATTQLLVSSALIEERCVFLQKEEQLFKEMRFFEGALRPFLWTKPLFLSEIGIARELTRLNKGCSQLKEIDVQKALSWVQTTLNIQLAQNQYQAVVETLLKKTHIITGGPGTGKSTITKAILSIHEKLTSKIILAAPTGRAAKRMSEICQKKAFTIHSLLEFDFKTWGFKKNRENPLDCDLIVIDEASMIDTRLMYHLLRAIPSQARVLFVGDIHQLPSVGPGNVLKDMIESKRVDVTQLQEIFRQAAGSKIITNAHRILKGIFPETISHANSDFFFLEKQEPEAVLKEIISLVYQRLPKKYGLHPIHDIQVLAPMKKGIIGTENLNHELQETLNPQHWYLLRAGKKWSIGDKVMQIRNNYKKEVFNGDIGLIRSIDQEEEELLIQFDDKEVVFHFSELTELTLAYAISVHKYQGSECPCVVIPVHTTHFKLLNRNLLYTAVTRGKRLVILVGTKKALAIAVKNDEVLQRYTGLKEALLET